MDDRDHFLLARKLQDIKQLDYLGYIGVFSKTIVLQPVRRIVVESSILCKKTYILALFWTTIPQEVYISKYDFP